MATLLRLPPLRLALRLLFIDLLAALAVTLHALVKLDHFFREQGCGVRASNAVPRLGVRPESLLGLNTGASKTRSSETLTQPLEKTGSWLLVQLDCSLMRRRKNACEGYLCSSQPADDSRDDENRSFLWHILKLNKDGSRLEPRIYIRTID
jgi:hypothetical protein